MLRRDRLQTTGYLDAVDAPNQENISS